MNRDLRFDFARMLCMSLIVCFVHLWAYIHPEVTSAIYVHPVFDILTNSCLGLFTFASGYLLGDKYSFGGKNGNSKIWPFYKKRVLRIIPLFLLAALALYLIGFNSARATLNGVICISPFVKPRPMTLWYIPVILWCYFITPLISRKNFAWRLISGVGLLLAVWLIRHFVNSIDWRFLFNMLLYLVGLVSAPYFNWKFENRSWIKWLVVVIFIGLLSVTFFKSPNVLFKRTSAFIGVFALLFVCEYIANLVFHRSASGEVSPMGKIIINVSYASMACYMFHRLFFWAGEMIWNPATVWVKWLYMAGVVFPVMLVLSYYIQKGYDLIIEKTTKKK